MLRPAYAVDYATARHPTETFAGNQARARPVQRRPLNGTTGYEEAPLRGWWPASTPPD